MSVITREIRDDKLSSGALPDLDTEGSACLTHTENRWCCD